MILSKEILRNTISYCKLCMSKFVSQRRAQLREKAREYYNSKCNVCGYNKCSDALEFHHIDSSKKKFGINDSRTRS
jgi:predicted restriction endonuclease